MDTGAIERFRRDLESVAVLRAHQGGLCEVLRQRVAGTGHARRFGDLRDEVQQDRSAGERRDHRETGHRSSGRLEFLHVAHAAGLVESDEHPTAILATENHPGRPGGGYAS